MEQEYLTAWRLVVKTIIGPIGVRVACELIIASSAAAAAVSVQSKVGCGFVILTDSVGGCEMASERTGFISAECRDRK